MVTLAVWLRAGVLIAAAACGLGKVRQASSQPNIVFIMADDMGFNDIGYNNPDMNSTRLDMLASQGVRLTQSYVQFVCTPSRGALMTGKYPFHIGLQHGILGRREPHGLSINYTLLPEMLQNNNYSTHMIGKWHLGFCASEYLPLNRGFESFLGFYGGGMDFYSHTTGIGNTDFYDGDQIASHLSGQYTTDLFAERAEELIRAHDQANPMFLYLAFNAIHTPLDVSSEYYDLYDPSVRNEERRVISGMVTSLSDAVGSVVDVLTEVGMYDNTIIVFVSDNGGMWSASGNNHPLRGVKSTLYEGGTLTPAFVHSPLLEQAGYINSDLIHITDWMPTLLTAAGVDSSQWPADIDGLNQWDTISKGEPSPRSEIVYNIDDTTGTLQAAIRIGDFKLMVGDNMEHNNWYDVPSTKKRGRWPADITVGDTLLFNITSDPYEQWDLSQQMPDKVAEMELRLDELLQEIVIAPTSTDPNGSPNSNGEWETGWCTAQ